MEDDSDTSNNRMKNNKNTSDGTAFLRWEIHLSIEIFEMEVSLNRERKDSVKPISL